LFFQLRLVQLCSARKGKKKKKEQKSKQKKKDEKNGGATGADIPAGDSRVRFFRAVSSEYPRQTAHYLANRKRRRASRSRMTQSDQLIVTSRGNATKVQAASPMMQYQSTRPVLRPFEFRVRCAVLFLPPAR